MQSIGTEEENEMTARSGKGILLGAAAVFALGLNAPAQDATEMAGEMISAAIEAGVLENVNMMEETSASMTCLGTDVICDPVPGDTTDGHIFAAGAKLASAKGSVKDVGGVKYFSGDTVYRFTTMTTGTFAFDIKGLQYSTNKCAPYFVQINNAKGGRSKSEWQIRPTSGFKPRMELAWYGCCEAANYQGNKGIASPSGWVSLTMKWDPSYVTLYQGRDGTLTQLHRLSNRLGSKYVTGSWRGACSSRPTSGALQPAEIELPEEHYNCYTYDLKNIRLTAE